MYGKQPPKDKDFLLSVKVRGSRTAREWAAEGDRDAGQEKSASKRTPVEHEAAARSMTRQPSKAATQDSSCSQSIPVLFPCAGFRQSVSLETSCVFKRDLVEVT